MHARRLPRLCCDFLPSGSNVVASLIRTHGCRPHFTLGVRGLVFGSISEALMDTGIRAKITKRLVDAATAPSDGELRIWDTEIKGFLLRISPAGRKTYCLKYRFHGRQRWPTSANTAHPGRPGPRASGRKLRCTTLSTTQIPRRSNSTCARATPPCRSSLISISPRARSTNRSSARIRGRSTATTSRVTSSLCWARRSPVTSRRPTSPAGKRRRRPARLPSM